MILDVTKTAKLICSVIKKMPRYWDGKKLILEMKENNGRNWRQMEWIGWYFEYWCNKNLKGIMEMPHSKKYGNVSFDGYLEIPWDFKVHAQSGEKIIINDLQAIKKVINDFGCLGLIIVTGPVIYDNESQDFKKWHDKQKGKITSYVMKNIEKGAPSRQRKVSMKISKILFIKLDDDCLSNCCSIHKQGKNSNGKPREPKVLLDLRKIENYIVYQLNHN
jgi:hypothetical protein